MLDDLKSIKLLIDEDLSPIVARYLCENFYIDAVAARDRNLLGASDYQILKCAFDENRILVTANVADFEKFARSYEVHAGIIFICDGDLLRNEQIDIVTQAVTAINEELKAGFDMVNRVFYIAQDGTKRFENLSSNLPKEEKM